MYKEADFQNYFIEYPNKVLKGCRLIRSEFSLYKAREVLKTDIYQDFVVGQDGLFGRIDLIFRYRAKNYIAEIKCSNYEGSQDFFNSLKVLGYCEYFKFQTGLRDYYPAIILPKDKVTLEVKIICTKLKIKIFSIVLLDKGFILEPE